MYVYCILIQFLKIFDFYKYSINLNIKQTNYKNKMKKFSLIFGGAGSLGDSIVQKMSKGFKTISIDIKGNKNANHSVELNPQKEL